MVRGEREKLYAANVEYAEKNKGMMILIGAVILLAIWGAIDLVEMLFFQ